MFKSSLHTVAGALRTWLIAAVITAALVPGLPQVPALARAGDEGLDTGGNRPAAAPAAADAPAGWGRLIGASFLISGQAEEELNPAIAYNNHQQEYLVVWWNDRPGNDDIRAERVSRSGNLLGSAWVASGAGADRQYPRVAYNTARREYLVVWEHRNSGGSEWNIAGQRLSVPSGPGSPQKVGGLINIAQGVTFTADCTRPAVAYSTTSDAYLVVFMYGWGTHRIQGRVLSGNGAPAGTVFDLAAATGTSQEAPDLAYNGRQNGYLVVWQERVGDYDIYARLVHPDGSLVGPGSFAISGLPVWEETKPHVAAIRTATALGEYAVVWQRDNSISGLISLQLVTGNGNLTGFMPRDSWSFTPGSYVATAIAGNENSQQFLVIVKLRPDTPLEAATVDRDLFRWSEWGWVDMGSGSDHPVAASGSGGEFLMVFDKHPFASRDVYGRRWGYQVLLPLVTRH